VRDLPRELRELLALALFRVPGLERIEVFSHVQIFRGAVAVSRRSRATIRG
jgi:hypothetical protein